MFVYAYLYGPYGPDHLAGDLEDVLMTYKELADRADRETGSTLKAGEMSTEKLMIIVTAAKRLLFVDVEGVPSKSRLAIFNKVFGLNLTVENYLLLQDWFGLKISEEAALDEFVAMFDCPGLQAMLASYRARGFE